MSRVILFGGSGFIGGSIRAEIDGVVTPSRAEVDLANAAAVRAFLRPGDVIINAAGYAAATDRSAGGWDRLRRENVHAVEVLSDEAARSGASQLIHISSVAAMGHREGTAVTEEMVVPPRSPYATSKRDAEAALAHRAARLPITILRPTSVFGEGRPLAVALCRIAGMPFVPLPGGGRALIPFTYVGNVATAVRLAIGNEACFGRTFIVGDETSYPLRDIVRGLAEGMGASSMRSVPVPARLLRVASLAESLLSPRHRTPLLDRTRVDTLTRSVSYSIEAFQRATGYRPPIGMAQATERIGAWYRNRRRR